MDANNGGTGVGYADTLTKAADFADKNNVETIVNGHFATTTTRADLREFIHYVRDFVKSVQDGKRQRQKHGRSRKGLGDAGAVHRLRGDAGPGSRARKRRADLQRDQLSG